MLAQWCRAACGVSVHSLIAFAAFEAGGRRNRQPQGGVTVWRGATHSAKTGQNRCGVRSFASIRASNRAGGFRIDRDRLRIVRCGGIVFLRRRDWRCAVAALLGRFLPRLGPLRLCEAAPFSFWRPSLFRDRFAKAALPACADNSGRDIRDNATPDYGSFSARSTLHPTLPVSVLCDSFGVSPPSFAAGEQRGERLEGNGNDFHGQRYLSSQNATITSQIGLFSHA